MASNDPTKTSTFDFGQEGASPDVVVICKGRQFHAHKTVLVTGSPYLHQLLLQAGEQQQSQKQIVLNSEDPEAMSAAIRFLYTGQLENVDLPTLEKLVPLAEKLQLRSLTKKSLDKLLTPSHVKDPQFSFIRIVNIIDKLGVAECNSTMVRFLQQEFDSVKTQNDFLQFNADWLLKVILSPYFHVTDQASFVQAIMRWVMYDPDQRGPYLGTLLLPVTMNKQVLQNLRSQCAENNPGGIIDQILSLNTHETELTNRGKGSLFDSADSKLRKGSTAAATVTAQLRDLIRTHCYDIRPGGGIVDRILSTSLPQEQQRQGSDHSPPTERQPTNAGYIVPQADDATGSAVENKRPTEQSLNSPCPSPPTRSHQSFDSPPITYPMHPNCKKVKFRVIGYNDAGSSETHYILHEYCPDKMTWALPLLLPLTARRDNIVVLGNDDEMFVIEPGRVIKFNLASHQKTKLPMMLLPRTEPGVLFYDGCLFVVGGVASGKCLKEVEFYNTSKNRWEQLTSMHVPRRSPIVHGVGKNLFVILGSDLENHIATLEKYDAEESVWTRIVTPVEIMKATANFWFDRWYTTGLAFDFYDQQRRFVFSPESNTWTEELLLTPLPRENLIDDLHFDQKGLPIEASIESSRCLKAQLPKHGEIKGVIKTRQGRILMTNDGSLCLYCPDTKRVLSNFKTLNFPMLGNFKFCIGYEAK